MVDLPGQVALRIDQHMQVDNAACEGFFGLLKRERIYRTRYPTLDAARSDVFEYIERRHNLRMRRRQVKQDQKFSALSKQPLISG